ncbi:MAG: right-handed parallel beta-helix repeat-containing protein, partial [Oscillospiraceae bacterium]|nr:right-handed parallel beta-helix repeat-containing protein [Oscillospiraceae bacterium]
MSDTQLGTNTRKKISAGGVIGIIAGAAVVVAAAVLAVVLLYQGGIASQPEQTDDITGFEQLQAALADPDGRTLTLNTDLESTGTLTVVGRKSLTGTGKLTVKLGGSSTYAVFEVTNGADLTLEGITIEGSVTADGVNVHSGAKATLKNVAIYWPYQYGVYADGEAVLENVNIDNALTAAVQASEGTVTVRGGKLTNSQSLAVYLHNNGTVILDGNVVIDGSNKHGITNRGKLTVSEATIENCDQYGIVNYGRLTVGNGSADAVCIGKNGNGAIYNYAGGRVEARDLKLYESGHSAISNNGEMTLSDSRIESSATNGVLNTAQMTATGLTITGSGNCGIYNRNPGDLKLNASVITDSDRRGVHNMGGTVELTDVTIDTCGTMGIANTVDGYGNAGKLTAVGTAVSGCNSNVYNEKAGVETTLIGCTLNKSKATNVVTSYGTMTLDNTRVLGSGNEGSYCVQVAKGAICTIKGGSVITGAASRGVTNHGTMTISGADVYGNNSHASGGGVYTDGTLYISGGCIHDNTATTSGGGIALGYSSTDPELVGKLYMTGGAIYANKATNNGGGIYVSKGVAYNEGGEIRNCYAEVTGGEIYGNSAGNVGSGMSVSGKAGLGGAAHFGAGNDIYLASGVVLEMAGLTAHNAADPLVINTAAKTGTVIAAADSEDAATKVLAAIRHGGVTGSFVRFGREIVVGESTYVPGDEIDMADAETVEVSTFLQLKEAVEGTPSGKKRVIRVTADIAMESTVTVPYGTVVQLTDPASAVTLRRAASMTSGYLFSVTPQAIFTLRGTAAARLTLDGNASVAVTGEDGALLYNRGVLMLETVTLQNANAAQSYGGLLRSPSGVVSVKNAVLSGGYAKNGGAIFVSGGQMTLTDTTLTGNSSVASGGAIRYQGGTLVIEGGSFTGNSGTTGGAIIADTGVALKITDTSFQNNTTTGGHGGAVYLSGESSLVAVNAVFDGNTAGGSGSYYGGALGLNGASSATLTGCMFDGNAVTHEGNNNGGAVYVGGSSALTVTGGTFRNNRAYGDANANGGAIYGNSGTVTVEAASFENNSAKNGGAIYVIGYTLTVNSAAFSGNTTAVTGGGGGGALYAADSVDTVIRVADSTFTGNTAGTYGGVINVLKNGTVSFSDSAFTGNTARSGNDANTFMVSSDGVLTLRSVAVTPADAAAGDVRLQNRAVVNVGDACKLGLVKLAYTTARVHLLSALPEGAAMTLIPAEYTAGSQLVSEESAGLVAGSADRITVAANGAEKWMLDADGQLLPDQTTALIGQTRYDTPAAALAAAQSGETVTLIENVTSGTALTVPAGVTLDGGGKTLTADVALADTAHLENIAVSGGVTLDGDAELSTVTVSGTVTVAAGATLTAGGDFRTDTVALGAGAVIALDSALGDVSIKVTSANEAPGTVLLTGDAELVAAEFTKFRAVLTDGRLYIDQTGKIDLRPFRALIVGR